MNFGTLDLATFTSFGIRLSAWGSAPQSPALSCFSGFGIVFFMFFFGS